MPGVQWAGLPRPDFPAELVVGPLARVRLLVLLSFFPFWHFKEVKKMLKFG